MAGFSFGCRAPPLEFRSPRSAVLASRVERYLAQHPYVRSLTVNVFNPGHATVLADALTALQRQPAFRDLRYDLRLFVPDPDAPGVGEAITSLLAGEATLAGEAFSIPSGSNVFPKLMVAIRSTRDFRAAPSRYRAHLSLLFEVFPPEEVAAGPGFDGANGQDRRGPQFQPWSKAAMKSPGQRRGDGKGRGFHSEMAREGALAHLPSQCG